MEVHRKQRGITSFQSAHSVAPSPLFKCKVLMVPRKHATQNHTLIYVRYMISSPQPHQLLSQFS
ncbi:hypothetical protein ES288_D02G215800v1 [Gossypium darwinii]|uniref:Uncharacterized protein n=2 Tax=Gossypium TaxID=3633 RepID=A0A5D2M093_GOSTO|nr:hypothetical protein ES288_D02G215800v1 [Gossypium darwinii]TYH84773.1 hypothetical protein ES332_D02G219100v1 [Gossypium tomentosum]